MQLDQMFLKSGLAAIAMTGAAPVLAQSAEGDIVVTARKRDETSLSVPVAIAAVGAAELERRAITKIDELGSAVPQLQVGEASGGAQGGTITLRGLGSGDGSGLIDQSVSFVIDGAPVARASVRRMSEVDIQQIEVLKGPQALFFGKNSPGGIISIRTADPTQSLAAKISAGYEFNGKEAKVDGFVAGPITDTLGARFAFYGGRLGGDVENLLPKGHPLRSEHGKRPFDREIGGRFTLKWDPSDVFSARFKLSYGRLKTAGLIQNGQFVYCALGNINQYNNPLDDCKANGNGFFPGPGEYYGTRDFRYKDGSSFLLQTQVLSSLELNYKLSDQLTLTSVTSLYDVNLDYADNLGLDVNVNRLVSASGVNIRDFTQEVRVASYFDGPVNFTIGGYYATTDGRNYIDAFVGTVGIGRQLTLVDGDAYSVFGQATWDIMDTLELAGGARYSHEKKHGKYFRGRDPGIFDFALVQDPASRSFNNVSPEATLTWRPSKELTFFGGYHAGFLSGGYSSAVSAATDRSYDQQKTKGVEAGAKGLFFNGKVRANLTAYDYVTTGLQLTVVFVLPTGGTSSQVLNAGKVTTKGIEGDFTWRTPLDGFDLRGAFGYNKARYDRFTALCYRGQSISAGCNQVLNVLTGGFTQQDLAGQQVVRAPDWVFNGGATYDFPVASGLSLSVSGDVAYTDGFFTETRNIPGSRQPSYWLVDGSVRLINDNSGWELALIGKNLTDKYYFIRTAEAASQGTAPGFATGVVADMIGSVSRGRQIMLRATLKLGAR